jgi:hypothetical protein
MPLTTIHELTLDVLTPEHLGAHLATQQVGIWVPTACEVQPKQLVRLRVTVGAQPSPQPSPQPTRQPVPQLAPLSSPNRDPIPIRLRFIGEVLEVERGGRGRGARVQLGPSGWARLRAMLYDSPR